MVKSNILLKNTLTVVLLLSPYYICAQENGAIEKSWLNKAKHVLEEEQPSNHAKKSVTPEVKHASEERSPATVSSSTLSLIRPNSSDIVDIEEPASGQAVVSASAPASAPSKQTKHYVNEEKPAADTAVKQPQFKKAIEEPVKKPESNVKWLPAASSNFNIRMEKHTNSIMTPNLGMKFETIHQILRRNIPWMMGGKASVDVYQNRSSFLRNEPNAQNWSGAFFSPSENRIVMYDDPSNTTLMISQFMHELTHLFVEDFFNPPGKPFKLEPPIWLNEGLAVNMEDIGFSDKGGTWANDLVVINILSSGDKKEIISRIRNGQPPAGGFGANAVSTKVVVFKNFGDFIKSDSYAIAEANRDVENWYFQAYAMVRFLFRPYNGSYPEKRMQFEQFSKLMKTFEEKKDDKGRPVRDANGKTIMQRTRTADALRTAYGFRDVKDFEVQFWKWLRSYQDQERRKLRNG